MFRKVLGYAAFAVGGIFAVKLVFGILGFAVVVIMKLALLALLALGIYAVLKVFVPTLFGTDDAGHREEEILEVEEVEVAEEATPREKEDPGSE